MCAIELRETMAEDAEREPDLAAILKTQGMKEALMGLRVDVVIMIVIVM